MLLFCFQRFSQSRTSLDRLQQQDKEERTFDVSGSDVVIDSCVGGANPTQTKKEPVKGFDTNFDFLLLRRNR